MTDMTFAAQNGRTISKEDKIFGINNRAQARAAQIGKENVVNATIGALLDDDGKLIVLSSVDEVFRQLSPEDYAEYAPIGGTEGFKEAVKKDIFRGYRTNAAVEAVSTPGGTGAVRNAIANYSEYGDTVLTTDWYWGPYKTIAEDQGKKLTTFELFDEEGGFNFASLMEKSRELLEKQDRLVIILNTPSHNPTGYALSVDEWEKLVELLNGLPENKKIALLVDAAYMDFSGDEEESRAFLPVLEKVNGNILPMISYSLSKAYTLYGLRCGALVCMAKNKDVAEEFRVVCELSARGAWSNCAKAPQAMLSMIFDDPELLRKVTGERKLYRDMLIRRGMAFTEAAEKVGLKITPFRSGFFMTVPCDDPEALGRELEKENIFVVPMEKGIRISGASIPESVCKKLPAAIKKAMEKM